MSEAPAIKKKPGTIRKLVIAIAACGVLGGAAGIALPILMNRAEAEEATPAAAAAKDSLRAELAVGRITVALSRAGERPRHLVIDPIVEYDAADLPHVEGEGAPLDGKQSHIRDAFIEYLTQVSEPEISGSSGMANLRAELLRRARAVTGSEAPKAILIQDYIIQ